MRPRLAYNINRLSRISLQNVGRNMLLSTATTVMMGLILFIFNVIMVLNTLTQSTLNDLAEKIDLIIYVNDASSLYEVNNLVKEVEALSVVKEVEYTSSDQALEEFISLYPDKSDPFTVYGIENPLPANLRIVTNSPDEHEVVLTHLEESPYADLLLDVESSGENQVIAARLLSVTDFTQKLIVGVVVTFILGSLLMIMNAIHLSIFTRKTEIQIMQLVGARYSMIQLPFLFEGAFYSFIAVFFSFFLLMFFLEGTSLSNYLSFQFYWSPLWLFLGEMAVSVGVGVLSSYVATHFYLKRTLVLE
ncbi:MAG: permease-like cell division protein FtsX [Patescibacteria group bacterium]